MSTSDGACLCHLRASVVRSCYPRVPARAIITLTCTGTPPSSFSHGWNEVTLFSPPATRTVFAGLPRRGAGAEPKQVLDAGDGGAHAVQEQRGEVWALQPSPPAREGQPQSDGHSHRRVKRSGRYFGRVGLTTLCFGSPFRDSQQVLPLFTAHNFTIVEIRLSCVVYRRPPYRATSTLHRRTHPGSSGTACAASTGAKGAPTDVQSTPRHVRTTVTKHAGGSRRLAVIYWVICTCNLLGHLYV